MYNGRFNSLIRHAVTTMKDNCPEWYGKYHREMSVWYTAMVCLVDENDEQQQKEFDRVFENWMQRSGFLLEAKHQMSPRSLKNYHLDVLELWYV